MARGAMEANRCRVGGRVRNYNPVSHGPLHYRSNQNMEKVTLSSNNVVQGANQGSPGPLKNLWLSVLTLKIQSTGRLGLSLQWWAPSTHPLHT
ncbi:hypothetical protein AMTR_s00002p00241060 [Amborella trichopoda]|uniref:Uncharacterized protein n=1 Tax=Amborella trichopoda TaxID=13333 RepID=W1NUD6_AMBTC|nr:hypothetical protein AMTR_s00002p00241060 [Amborella trichopoda]